MLTDCIFCKIIAGQLPSEKIYEDAHTLAFLDMHPVNRGHTLVIPKRHYKNLFDLPEEELCAVVIAAKKIAPAIQKGVGAQGINIIMNNDAAAGQLVFHAHIHVVPRFENDGFRHWRGIPYPDGTMKEVANTIREELGA